MVIVIGRNKKSIRSEVFETVLYQRALLNAQKAMIEEGYPLSQHLIKTLRQQLLYWKRVLKNHQGNTSGTKLFSR